MGTTLQLILTFVMCLQTLPGRRGFEQRGVRALEAREGDPRHHRRPLGREGCLQGIKTIFLVKLFSVILFCLLPKLKI